MMRIYRIAGKFGGSAVYVITAKLKSAKIFYSHIRMAILAIAIWAQQPNLIPTNISSYTVHRNNEHSRRTTQLFGKCRQVYRTVESSTELFLCRCIATENDVTITRIIVLTLESLHSYIPYVYYAARTKGLILAHMHVGDQSHNFRVQTSNIKVSVY